MKTPVRHSALVLLALVLAAGLAWWLGRQQGMAMMSTPAGGDAPAQAATAKAAATSDPSQWTIRQGEVATLRHIEAGLKAGDVDPATGLRILNYHDPMVPGKNFDAPAKSPFMDMMLVPRYAGAGGSDASSISVSPRIQQNLGLRTAPAVMGTLAGDFSAVGSVVWNERDQVLLQSRATGFVEQLHVRATLDRVAAGAPIAEIYVPAWVAVQEDYLALVRMAQGKGGADLLALREAARQRMRLAGMDEVQIQQVVDSGQLQPRFVLRAPRAGVLTELMLREGATVMAGDTLARVQGTASVWAEGEVPESQAALLRPGAAVTASSPALPGQRFSGRVQALLPQVDPATRTRRARLELANPGARLVPGMFVQLRFERPGQADTLLVPADAVIRTGRRSVVMLAEDEGRFRPVEVQTGLEAGGQVEITLGLQAGQRVVLSGQFLIDSEASLSGLQLRLNEAADPAGGQADPTRAVHRTEARVQAVDGDTVTLDHPPIASLKWPQMVMDFRLPEARQQPRGLAAGDRVQVEFRMQDGDVPQITAMRRLGPQSGPGAAASAAAGAGR